MSKMASHEPFWHLQHKLWLKEGSKVKLAVWLPTTKSWESTRSQCVQMECNKFASDLIPIRGLSRELWAPKVLGVSTGTVSGLLLRSPRNKSHLVPRSNIENTIWGKVVASPNSGSWWVQWVKVARGLSQHQKCSGWILTNLWLVLL
jgi:hypothetical protein